MSLSRETTPSPTEAPARPRRNLMLALLRATAFVAIGALGLGAGGFGVFATYIGELSTPADVPPADAIIVLTGGHARLDAGLQLLRSGKGKRLLISGVHPDASARDLQAVTGADRSLFSCCVDIDREALDTVGNAEESAKWVKGHHYGSVLLVTNNYHMPRSLLEVGRLIGNAELEPYPVVNANLANGGWIVQPEALRVLFTEYNKYLLALARGAFPLPPAEFGVAAMNASAAAPD